MRQFTKLTELRYDDRRGGESYRPASRPTPRSSLSYRPRSPPPRNRSPPPRLAADTWAPSTSRAYPSRPPRSRSPPPARRRSRSPSFNRHESYGRTRTPRKFSPIRDERPRSPPRRSRSPYGENRLLDAPSGPRRNPRDPPSPRGDLRPPRRDEYVSYASSKYSRPVSPSRRGTVPESYHHASFRHGSPVREGRPPGSRSRRPSPSASKSAPSGQTSAPDSYPTSRRSSPSIHPDKTNITPSGPRGRSPVNERLPSAQDTSVSYQERKHLASSEAPPQNERWQDERTTVSGRHEPDPGSRAPSRSSLDQQVGDPMKGVHSTSSIPNQPRSYRSPQHHLPSPGNHHGPSSSSSQSRGPNVSLLSAPTGPRGSGFRDHPLAGTPSRRDPAPAAPHAPPLGPRANTGPGGPRNEPRQYSGLRQGTATPTLDSRPQRPTNHLAGLSTVIPGGKLIPPSLDIATTKRLSQLEADRERLFEQAAGAQKLKRVLLMDWDKLDRESSICDLRSELAEGHLQYMTDGEGIHAGVTF